MKSQEYWRKREQNNIKRLLKNDINYQKEIERIYAKNLRNIEVRIDSLYRRYGNENGEISLADVKVIADKTDVAALAETARKMSQDKDFSQYANDVLARYNLKMQVSRLELLKDEINLELIENGVNVDKYVANKLTDETKAELKRQAGILGESLDVTDTKLVTNIINGSFGSSTFSERLWGNTQYLANSLDTLLTQSIINGRHPNDVARELRRQFDISQKQAERLMRTESAMVHAECAVKSMEKNGVKKYEWVSEPSACEICSPLNGKTFEVKGAEFGNVNHPLFPLHPNCRCAVISVINRISCCSAIASSTIAIILSLSPTNDKAFASDFGSPFSTKSDATSLVSLTCSNSFRSISKRSRSSENFAFSCSSFDNSANDFFFLFRFNFIKFCLQISFFLLEQFRFCC